MKTDHAVGWVLAIAIESIAGIVIADRLISIPAQTTQIALRVFASASLHPF